MNLQTKQNKHVIPKMPNTLKSVKWLAEIEFSNGCDGFFIPIDVVLLSDPDMLKSNELLRPLICFFKTFDHRTNYVPKFYCASYILLVTSNHQTPNLVFPNFVHEFFSAWKRKQTFYWSSKTDFFFFSFFDP